MIRYVVLSHVSRKTISFLRALKRNNDREWFRARKEDYEQHVRATDDAAARTAGRRHAGRSRRSSSADPKVSLFRIYRDTRFSSDKTPLKTHVAARFPIAQLRARTRVPDCISKFAPGWVWIGGGMYMPSTPDLHAIRAQIASTHPRLHRLVTAPAFKETSAS